MAITWDAAGRMFVAEMGDYPVGPERGRIRLLADRDRDGRYETSQVFADSIPFPTGVLAVRDGLFVTAAPDILFYRIPTATAGPIGAKRCSPVLEKATNSSA